MKLLVGVCLLLSTLFECTRSATIPALSFVEDIRCGSATPTQCQTTCKSSGACVSVKLFDFVWQRCLRTMTAQCTWNPFVFYTFAVEDVPRSCANVKANAIMLSHAEDGLKPPFQPQAPSGIKWTMRSADVEACRKATFTVEMTPGHQNMTTCMMQPSNGLASYERFEHVALRVIDEREVTGLRDAQVAVIAVNENSQVVKNEGLTIRITIEQPELASKCLFLNQSLPSIPSIIQGRITTARGG